MCSNANSKPLRDVSLCWEGDKRTLWANGRRVCSVTDIGEEKILDTIVETARDRATYEDQTDTIESLELSLGESRLQNGELCDGGRQILNAVSDLLSKIKNQPGLSDEGIISRLVFIEGKLKVLF